MGCSPATGYQIDWVSHGAGAFDMQVGVGQKTETISTCGLYTPTRGVGLYFSLWRQYQN